MGDRYSSILTGHALPVEVPAILLEYDDIIDNPLSAFVALCAKLGGNIATMVRTTFHLNSFVFTHTSDLCFGDIL